MSVKTKAVGLLTLLCVLTLTPVTAEAKPKEKKFNVAADKLFDAVMAVAAEGYEVTYSSEDRKTVSFNTGSSATTWGMHCTASVHDKGENKSLLKLNVRKTKGQLFAWGAGGRVAKKFFNQAEEKLAELQQDRQAEEKD